MQSVLTQTVPAHDIIIVDDGSEERFQAKIQDTARLGAQISVFRFQSARGVSAARNFGLQKAQGDYILFLDDDDLLHPRMIESNLSVFGQDPGVDVVTCLSKAFIGRSPFLFSQHDCGEPAIDPSRVLYPINHIDYMKLERLSFSALLRYTLVINSCLVRKDCLEHAHFPEDLTVGEDTYLWLKLVSQGCNFTLNRNSLVFVRVHGESCRLRADYNDATLQFFSKLLSSGMLRDRHDLFLVHAHLFLKLYRMKRLEMIRPFLYTLKSPDLILKSLLSYYSTGARKMRCLYKFLEGARHAFPADEREMKKFLDEYEELVKTSERVQER